MLGDDVKASQTWATVKPLLYEAIEGKLFIKVHKRPQTLPAKEDDQIWVLRK